jgi:hypothetical protein
MAIRIKSTNLGDYEGMIDQRDQYSNNFHYLRAELIRISLGNYVGISRKLRMILAANSLLCSSFFCKFRIGFSGVPPFTSVSPPN